MSHARQRIREELHGTSRGGSWVNLSGKPFVTVSPIGTAQGKPVNNGADFGPDTPSTTTSGWQEAYNSQKPVIVEPGLYSGTEPQANILNGICIFVGTTFGLPGSGGNFAQPTAATSGAVYKVTGAASQNGFHITVPQSQVIMKNLSWDLSSITAPGHGLFIDAETYMTANPPQSFPAATMMQGFEFDNLYVYGYGLGKYAYWHENILNGTIGNLYAQSGGGFIKWRTFIASGSAVAAYNFSNCTMNGYYQWYGGATTVDVISYDVVNNQAGATGLVNIIYMYGVVSLGPAGNLSVNLIKFGAGTQRCFIYGLDTASVAWYTVPVWYDTSSSACAAIWNSGLPSGITFPGGSNNSAFQTAAGGLQLQDSSSNPAYIQSSSGNVHPQGTWGFQGGTYFNRTAAYTGPTPAGAGNAYTMVPAKKAGAPTDADFASPTDGMIVVDTSTGTGKLWVRVGGSWVGVLLT